MLSRLATLGRPYLRYYAAGFLLLLLTNGLSLWIPWLLRDAIRALERGAPLRVITGFVAAMTGIALGQAVVRTASRWAILGASRRIAYDVRNGFFARLQLLGPSFYDSERTGDIMSRGVNDVRLVQAFFGPGLMNLLNTSIVYVAVLVLLLGINVRLTVVSLLLYPLLFFGVNRLSRRVYARSLAVQEQLAEISNRAQENFSGIQQVKIYVQEEREASMFRDLCAEYRRRNLSMAALRGGMLALIGIVSGLGTLIVLYVGGRLVIEGGMGLGEFVAFNAYLALLVWPTIALGWIINTIQRGTGAMRRIEEIMRREPDIVSPGEPATTVAGATAEADRRQPERFVPVDGDIRIRGLSFTYPGRTRGERRALTSSASLHEIDLEIPRGSRVALVGPVGSGKSTLANLLARLYPVPPGTIFIGGVDVNEIPLARLRRSIGYVPQESFLFSRSLRENITMNRPGVTDADIEGTVEFAHLAADVASFPEGLETPVGERGFTLSGGQRQRATLARALTGNPRLLILDDSLSSVDADTERAILDALRDQAKGRTLVLITHRFSTLADMDRIVVFEEGRIVQSGTHDELIGQGGAYGALFRRHMLEQRLSGS